MKKIDLKNGEGHVEFKDEEWAHMNKLWKSFKTAAEREEFWNTVLERKRADPAYSIFDAYPIFTDSEKDRVRKFGIEICEEMRRKLGGK
jgi:hypothetical protein